MVALFTEMYGIPLTVYLLSGWLGSKIPGLQTSRGVLSPTYSDRPHAGKRLFWQTGWRTTSPYLHPRLANTRWS